LTQLSGTVGNSPSLEISENISNLKKQINSNQSAITDLTEKYTWSSPEILNHKARLFNLIQDVEDEFQVLVSRQYAQVESNTKDLLTQLFNARYRECFHRRIGKILNKRRGRRRIKSARQISSNRNVGPEP